MLNGMKINTRIALALILIIVAGGAIWFVTQRADLLANTSPEASETPSASPTPVVIAYDDAPSDWPVYSSASLGYSVSYPKDWKMSSCGPGCVGWSTAEMKAGEFALGIIQTTGTLDTLLKDAEQYISAKEQLDINGNAWIRLTLKEPTAGTLITTHFIQQGEKLYEFGSSMLDANILSTYGQMIRSFKFLK